MGRPLVWVSLALAAGTYVAAAGLCAHPVVTGVVCIAGVAASVLARRRRYAGRIAVLVAFAGAGAFLWSVRHSGPPGDAVSRYAAARPPREYTIEGRVRHPDLYRPEMDYCAFWLDVDNVDTGDAAIPLRGRVLVRWFKPGGAIYADERVRIRGVLTQALGRANPGVNGSEEFLRRRRVQSAVRLRGPAAVERVGTGRWWWPPYWATRLRTFLASRLRHAAPESVLPFVLTVWLGDRNQVRDAEYREYLNSGTAHILAVSGVHIAIVFVSASFLLRFIVRRRLRTVITMGVVLAFALVAGARTSSMRAALMIILYLVADLFDREPDAPTALSIAGIVLLLVNPAVLFDQSFLLSFSSVASILLLRRPVGAALSPLPRVLRGGLGTTLAVQILPFPFVVRFFHVFPAIAPLANLVVIPLLTVALWLCFLASLCALVSVSAATLFGYALAPVVWLIRSVTGLAAHTPWGHLRVVAPTALAMTAYWGTASLFGMALATRGRRRFWVAGGLALAGIASLCWRPFSAEPGVVFLDVGHGDSTFILTPGGMTVLVDGGDAYKDADMGARVVGPFLWSRHMNHLDYVILSHPDQDHIGGLFYVLDQFSVGQVVLGPVDTGDPGERALMERCRSKGIPVTRVGRGDTIPLSGATLEVLHPPEDWPRSSSANDASLVLRLCWPGLELLLAGDLEGQGEAALAGAIPNTAILKVPHHGSRTSSSPDFIRAVRPRYCVVSTGGLQGRESVDPAVLAAYEAQGATVFRTDLDGAITLTIENGTPRFRPARAPVYSPNAHAADGRSHAAP